MELQALKFGDEVENISQKLILIINPKIIIILIKRPKIEKQDFHRVVNWVGGRDLLPDFPCALNFAQSMSLPCSTYINLFCLLHK